MNDSRKETLWSRYRAVGAWRLLRRVGLTLLLFAAAIHGPLLAEAPSPAAADPEQAPHGLVPIVFAGGWIGMLIVLFLVGLSLLAAYLVFDHVMTVRRSELMPDGLGTQVRDLLAAGRLAEAEATCRARPSFLSFVLLHGIAEVDGGWASMEKALEDALAEQSARLLRKIEYLSVIGNLAPMFGLLGTVTGMIIAFQRVAATQGTAGAGELAEGIYQALVTTVGGLLVAIPALAAFAILRNRVDQCVAEAAYLALHVFAPLKRRRPAGPPPAPPPRGGP